MRVNVRGGVADLERDCRKIAKKAPRELRSVVRSSLREGAVAARANARRTAGKHGKHYPRAIDFEMTGPLVGEYGPDSAKPQGGMSFEYGSVNQKPHLDLARSADELGYTFALGVRHKAASWFW